MSPMKSLLSMKLIVLGLFFYCCAEASALPLLDPDLRIVGTVTDVNGGTLQANDIIEYTYVITNIGEDASNSSVVLGSVPTNTAYVSGSLKIDGVAKSDGILDDTADYSGLNKKATFRLGTGANSLLGGTLNAGASTTVKMRVRINVGTADGTQISNQASATYSGLILVGGTANSDADLSIPGDQPNIIFVNTSAPSIGITQSVSPSGNQMPGTDLSMTSAFLNSGGSQAQNFAMADPVPANTDFKVGSVTSGLGTTGLTLTIQYSNNGGTTYVYTPVSAGGGAPSGYDRNVTHIRFAFTGLLSRTAPNNAGSVTFVSRIR